MPGKCVLSAANCVCNCVYLASGGFAPGPHRAHRLEDPCAHLTSKSWLRAIVYNDFLTLRRIIVYVITIHC